MRISIICGRFQLDALHEGHRYLINKALTKGDRLYIFLGCTTEPNRDNPLSFTLRKEMIRNIYGVHVEILPIFDTELDEQWNDKLNLMIYDILTKHPSSEVMLYGSRDSFLKTYNNKYPTEYIEPIQKILATQLRAAIEEEHTRSFRAGVIHAYKNIK